MVEIGGRDYLAKVFPGLPEEIFHKKPASHARYTSTENLIAWHHFATGQLTEEVAFSCVDLEVDEKEIDLAISFQGSRRR